MQLSEQLGISMELGCFMAGVVLSSMGEQLVHQVSISKISSSINIATVGAVLKSSLTLSLLTVPSPN